MTVDASLFRGLSAFPLTPTDADGVVDTDAFAVMIDRLVAAGVDSIAVLGSTGTYAISTEKSARAPWLALSRPLQAVPADRRHRRHADVMGE